MRASRNGTSSLNTEEWRTASLATLKTMWEGASSLLPGRKLVPWKTIENFLLNHFEPLPVVYMQGGGATKGQPQWANTVSPHSFRKAWFCFFGSTPCFALARAMAVGIDEDGERANLAAFKLQLKKGFPQILGKAERAAPKRNRSAPCGASFTVRGT